MQNTGIIQIRSDLLRFADLLESQIAEIKYRANKVQRHPAPFQAQLLLENCHLFSSLVDFSFFTDLFLKRIFLFHMSETSIYITS